MQLDTRVFERIVRESKQGVAQEYRKAAVRAISQTMSETARFGTFSRDYLDGCAGDRFDSVLRQG